MSLNWIILVSVLDPRCFLCGYGSSFLPHYGSGYGSGSRSRELTNAVPDPDPGQTVRYEKLAFDMKNVLYVGSQNMPT
jgi:hypothetical protein